MIKADEVEIKAPWGHIVGKIWGDWGSNSNKPFALMFHGLGDNAGSFDRLVPYLPPRYRYVSIDLPGHGFSSHFPPHVPLHANFYLIAYRVICRHFGQGKYVFIAHSLGAQLGMLFAQLYPDLVEALVMLDAVHMFPISTEHYKKIMVGTIEKFMDLEVRLESAGGRPTYTYDEAFDKLRYNRMVSDITEDGARALMERSVLPTKDGHQRDQRYYFTSDPRLKFLIPPIRDERYILETLNRNPLKCRVLIVLASGNMATLQKYFPQVLEKFEKLETVSIVRINGLHDVHNDHPERVAPVIVNFLDEGIYKAKL